LTKDDKSTSLLCGQFGRRVFFVRGKKVLIAGDTGVQSRRLSLFRPDCDLLIGKMVLDIELFRPEKGGDPNKIRALQEKRFKSVKLVDEVVDNDTLWRQCKYHINITHLLTRNYVDYQSLLSRFFLSW